MAGQGSQPRARRIHQNSIKVTAPLGPYFEQVGGVGRKHLQADHAETLGVGNHLFEPSLGAIHRPDFALIIHQLRQLGGLASRGGAGIQNPLPRLWCQQGGDGLGSAVLDAPVTFLETGQAPEIAAGRCQAQAPFLVVQGPGRQPCRPKGRQDLRPAASPSVDPQVEGRGCVAGASKGLGLFRAAPLQQLGRQPGG